MIINDIVYGKVEIKEPVLIELIKSKPIQRLKKINQAGARKFIDKKETITRYEHSIGVMLLLRILNASLEEQIAGLLHDIPHTAFSHVVDLVYKSENHDFHEKFHHDILLNSEIPNILKKHKYNIKKFLNEENFPLLERNLPDLCADRLDYSFRILKVIHNSKKIDKYLSDLTITKNEIVFSNLSVAKSFAEDFLMLAHSFSNPLEVAVSQILAHSIRLGLDNNVLTQDDLFKDDDFVYKKLKNSKNKDILNHLKLLNPKLKVRITKKDYDFYSKSKLRFVNPKVLNENLKRVGNVDKNFIKKVEIYKQKIKDGNYIKIIK